MKKVLILLAFFLSSVAINAAIELSDPVVGETYMKFEGVNQANNYRFILDTYEMGNNGPQFQLTLSRLDSSKPAAFTADDLNDPNYWEPMFRFYTLQMAGQEMEVYENIKRLYVNDVALQPNQFKGYYFKRVYINAGGDFTIPDGCFWVGKNEEGHGPNTDTFDCKIEGVLTLGKDVVSTEFGPLNIYTYREEIALTWWKYLRAANIAPPLYLNGELYEGPATIYGDVNNDGAVNVSDVNLLVSAALAGTCPDGYDLNNDNQINVTDINLCVSAVLTQ